MSLVTILKAKLVDWFIGWLRGWAEIEDAPPAEKSAEPQEKFIGRWYRWTVNKVTGRLQLLTIGQSDYNGKASNLPGCRLDARNMAALYGSYGAKVTERHNIGRIQTITEIQTALANHNGGTTVIHISSHGSQVRDRTGTEPDGKMEVVCCADMGLIGDDDLIAWGNDAVTKRGGKIILIYDTCHSGGMSRSIGAEVAEIPVAARMIAEAQLPGERVDEFLVERHHRGIAKADPSKLTVMMACEEQSYSYDSSQGGAYTLAFIRAAKRNGNATARTIFDTIRQYLPSPAFPQTPQMDGIQDSKIFG